MENNVQTSKIGVRDLVNVAIFTVIYFVIFYVCAMTGFVPVMAVFYPVLTAIIAGIPCILFYTKVKTFGLVTIMGVLLGLIFFLMGYGYYALITGIVFGLLADVIMKAGKYKSWKAMLAGYAVFSVWQVGTQLPMFIMGDAYVDMYRASQGDAFADGLAALVQGYMVPVVILATAVGGVIGAFITVTVVRSMADLGPARAAMLIVISQLIVAWVI